MFGTCLLMFNPNMVLDREIAGMLSREERPDRNRRVFLGRHARVFRSGREAKPGDARRRKRVHLCQDHGRVSVALRTHPRPGLRRRESRDTAMASRKETNHRRY